jgi:hypothetical protein
MGLVAGPLAAAGHTDIPLGTAGWSLWLDRTASWQNDTLYAPPYSIAGLPVNAPSCGWANLFSNVVPESEAAQAVGTSSSNSIDSISAEVPGTVEEFFWNAISGAGNGFGTSGDYVGVSWWGNSFVIPSSAAGQRVKLEFTEGIRQRAEVYVNQQLVGYEIVHQLPFEVDITSAAIIGGTNHVAVRITDPGGNFSWGDYPEQVWGTAGTSGAPNGYAYPMSHGFGGILGPINLRITNPVHVSDVYVQNQPALTDINSQISIENDGGATVSGSVNIAIVEAWQHGAAVQNPQTVYTGTGGSFSVSASGSTSLTLPASVPSALLWSVGGQNANLYNYVVTLTDTAGNLLDQYTQRFGFRFLSVQNFGVNTQLFLNNQRLFILSAISWGFWPVNGIFPTCALARQHVTAAQTLGLNMLNFHRCMGNTAVLNAADENGLLYYEEPGGYSSGQVLSTDPLYTELKNIAVDTQLMSNRVMRMVQRDRSHPSLIKYNMINEPGNNPTAQTISDMAAMHLADPERMISYGSGFMSEGGTAALKLNMLPYDQTQRDYGYCDIHNSSSSPGVYTDNLWLCPTLFWRNDEDPAEIFVWGEEDAIGTPPQLQEIQGDIAAAGRDGWDGADFTDWYNAYVNYINSEGVADYYPSLTNLLTSLSDVSYYEHGRLIENTRIADSAAMYIINGYEDEKLENLSGIVDCYRNIKGTPSNISQYMSPLMVAIKARNKIGQPGDTVLVDFYALNNYVLPAGTYGVSASVQNPDGSVQQLLNTTVAVSGGSTFSNLIAQAVPVPLNSGTGYYTINAQISGNGQTGAGQEQIFAVDWKSDQINGAGAVIAGDTQILNFLNTAKGANAVAYSSTLGPLNYVVLGSLSQSGTYATVSPFNFVAQDGTTPGLNYSDYQGIVTTGSNGTVTGTTPLVYQSVYLSPINYDVTANYPPGLASIGRTTQFSVIMRGYLIPSYTGTTQFQLNHDDGARVWVSGTEVINNWTDGSARIDTFTLNLTAGVPYPITIAAYQDGGGWELNLQWLQPAPAPSVDIGGLLNRVSQNGTKLLIVDSASSWMSALGLGALPTSIISAAACSGSSAGIQSQTCSEGGLNVAFITNGSYTEYAGVNLTGMQYFQARIASSSGSGSTAGTIDVYEDGTNGTLLAACSVPGTGGWQTWKTVSCALSSTSSGTHNLYLVYKGGGGYLYNLEWFILTPSIPQLSIPAFSIFTPGTTSWLGVNYFCRDHTFTKNLPVNKGMNWEYQRLVYYNGLNPYAFENIAGETPVVSMVGSINHLVATAVGTIPYGTGQIAYSTLNLVPNLADSSPEADVPKKLFCNMIDWANGSTAVNYPPIASLSGSAVSESQVQLAWTPNPTPVTDYVVEVSPHSANTWSSVATLPDGAPACLSGSLTPLTNYDFRVRYEVDGTQSPNTLTTVATPAGIGDGIPGWWRYEYFGNGLTLTPESAPNASPTGNGVTNMEAYLAGLDPLDPYSIFRIVNVQLNGTAAQITFSAVAGKTYTLLKSNTVGSGATWTTVVSNIAGVNGNVTVQDPSANGQSAFYEVLLQQ